MTIYTPSGLRMALRSNSIFSGVCGLAMTFFADQVISTLGYHRTMDIQVIGIGLMIFSVYLMHLSGRKKVKYGAVRDIIMADIGWVIGSVLLLLFARSWFSNTGVYLITGIALIVSAMAFWQYRALRTTKDAG